MCLGVYAITLDRIVRLRWNFAHKIVLSISCLRSKMSMIRQEMAELSQKLSSFSYSGQSILWSDSSPDIVGIQQNLMKSNRIRFSFLGISVGIRSQGIWQLLNWIRSSGFRMVCFSMQTQTCSGFHYKKTFPLIINQKLSYFIYHLMKNFTGYKMVYKILRNKKAKSSIAKIFRRKLLVFVHALIDRKLKLWGSIIEAIVREFLHFEVHITVGFKSEVFTFILRFISFRKSFSSSWKRVWIWVKQL